MLIDAAETKPTVADVSQTIAPSTATTISITGTNFVSIPQVEFIKTDGSITVANTVSFTNSTTLSVNVTLASGNYYVRVENPDGNAGRSTNNILTASTAPSFTTAAGSLGELLLVMQFHLLLLLHLIVQLHIVKQQVF